MFESNMRIVFWQKWTFLRFTQAFVLRKRSYVKNQDFVQTNKNSPVGIYKIFQKKIVLTVVTKSNYFFDDGDNGKNMKCLVQIQQ